MKHPRMIISFLALSVLSLISSDLFAAILSERSISVAECNPCFLNEQSDNHKAELFFVIDEDSEELKKLKTKIGINTQVFHLESKDGEYPMTNFGEYDIHVIDLNGDKLLDFGLGVPSDSRNPSFLYFLYGKEKGEFIELGKFGFLTPADETNHYLEKVITSRYYDFKNNYYIVKNESLKLVKKRFSMIDSKNQLATITEIKVINGKEEKIGTKLLPLKGTALLMDYFNNLTNAHKRALSFFRKKEISKSISNMEKYFSNYEYPLIFFGDHLNKKNLKLINDYAFFLEQGKRYDESIEILTYIISKVPDRVVAYINLGDAYYGANEIEKAKTAYQKYVDLIKEAGKEKRIPKRVYDRLK